eukprot:10945622-Alexandrium_andersonii.AAC.1
MSLFETAGPGMKYWFCASAGQGTHKWSEVVHSCFAEQSSLVWIDDRNLWGQSQRRRLRVISAKSSQPSHLSQCLLALQWLPHENSVSSFSAAKRSSMSGPPAYRLGVGGWEAGSMEEAEQLARLTGVEARCIATPKAFPPPPRQPMAGRGWVVPRQWGPPRQREVE